MGLSFTCPNCGNEVFIRYLKIGESAECKVCGTVTAIPQEAKSVESASGGPVHPLPAQAPAIPAAMATTALDLPGYRIERSLGIVRGLTVRSRSFVGDFGAAVESFVGGRVTAYIKLCEETRAEAFDLMLDHAREAGANAILGVRFDANDIADGITEVLCYGTAVVVTSLATERE